MNQKLNKKFVDSLTLPKSGSKIVWDTELLGFGIRLFSSKKSFIVQARVAGKTRRVTLGDCSVLSLFEARKMAREALLKMIKGVDPAIEKQKKSISTLTLAEIATDYKLNKKTRQGHHLKASTKADIDKHLRSTFKEWADSPIAKITEDGVRKIFAEASERSKAQSNQAFRILRALYNYARSKSKVDGKPTIPENPVNILSDPVNRQWNYVPSRSAQIPEKKIGVAWDMIQTMRTEGKQTDISRSHADFIAFLLLTGARFNEAAQLTWDRVDLKDGSWHLPDAKNRKAVTFPLSSLAVTILNERKNDSVYVFPARTKTGHVMDARHQLKRISECIGCKISAHDLRRTFRAIAAATGVELWKTKLLMNHAMSGDVTIQAYTEKNNLSYLKSDIEKIGQFIGEKYIESQHSVIDLQAERMRRS